MNNEIELLEHPDSTTIPVVEVIDSILLNQLFKSDVSELHDKSIMHMIAIRHTIPQEERTELFDDDGNIRPSYYATMLELAKQAVRETEQYTTMGALVLSASLEALKFLLPTVYDTGVTPLKLMAGGKHDAPFLIPVEEYGNEFNTDFHSDIAQQFLTLEAANQLAFLLAMDDVVRVMSAIPNELTEARLTLTALVEQLRESARDLLTNLTPTELCAKRQEEIKAHAH